MSHATIGLISPGEMGAAVGACGVAAGSRVCFAVAGRSAATRERARAAGLAEVADLAELTRVSDTVLSVCPPSAALEVARAVLDCGPSGVYVEANAVSPSTAREVAALFAGAGVSLVDGGIVGPPPTRAGLARLYLSGDRAAELAGCFAGSFLEAIPIEGGVGAASALKMGYAAWTKGTTALLAAIQATALAEGVGDALRAEWQRSIPDLLRRLDSLPGVGRKAWRFEGEMHEIADTFRDAGLPEGFHRAAAELFGRWARVHADREPSELEVLAAELARGPNGNPDETGAS